MSYQSSSGQTEESVGCVGYALGGASFIPLLGVPLGLLAILFGWIKWKAGGWKVVLLGAAGILFSVVLYGGLFYFGFVQRGGLYDKVRVQMAQQIMTELIKDLELYKVQKGVYPADLKELHPEQVLPQTQEAKDGRAGTETQVHFKVWGGSQSPQRPSFRSIYDPTCVQFSAKEPRLFVYEVLNNGTNYCLFSSGPDGQPDTADDIYPDLSGLPSPPQGYIRKTESKP
jgi:hypothetical protein